MSKDFLQIAHDVTAGAGMLRQGSPEAMKAFAALSTAATGATREEVAETVALAIYMGGGPAVVYGGDALRAYDQFQEADKEG